LALKKVLKGRQTMKEVPASTSNQA